jgi:hypothetical protein
MGKPAMVCQLAGNGTATVEEVLSMRLGKEQAAGYVEDTDSPEDTVLIENTAVIDNTVLIDNDTAAGAPPAEQCTTASSDGRPLTPAEASLTPR